MGDVVNVRVASAASVVQIHPHQLLRKHKPVGDYKQDQIRHTREQTANIQFRGLYFVCKDAPECLFFFNDNKIR